MSNLTKIAYLMLLSIGLSACTSLSGKNAALNPPLNSLENERALVFLIEKTIAKRLTSQERKNAFEAELKALEFGKTGDKINWAGDTADVFGNVTAYRPFRVGKSNCRRFDHIISVRKQKTYSKGTACLVGNGPWNLIN